MIKKYTYFFKLFGFFLLVSCDKEPVISKLQENFNLKVFGGSVTDNCYSIISDNDNQILTGSLDYQNGQDLFLIKTDKYGNEVDWSPKLFGSPLTDVGYAVTLDKDKNIILAGYSSTVNGFTDAFVVKTTPNGDALWSKRFGGFKDEKIYSVLALPNIIFLAGYTESIDFDVKKRQGWLLALSANGDSIWSQDFGTILVPDELHEIIELKDSLLVMGSTQSLYGNYKQDVFLFILKKSTKGIENSVTLFRPGNEIGISAVENNGDIFVLGYTQVSNTINNVVLWKLNKNLQIIKEVQIESPISETPASIKINNGNLVIIGTALNGPEDDDFLVYVLDNNLNKISRNCFGSSRSQQNQRGFSGTISGRSVIIGGSTTTGNSSKACIFKTPEILP